MKNKNKKWDFILIGIFLLAGLCIAICLLVFRQPGAYVVATVDGKEVARLELNEDTTLTIPSADGTGSNTLVIENGQAWVSDASCPDQLCMNMGKITSTGQSIICLPNKLVITIENASEEAEFDAVSQ